jgi:glycosyltransferase involved in cell wall biosynthesis
MQNKNILLSVIIPIWNAEKHLSTLYEVLKRQNVLVDTSGDCVAEVIFVDDGSTDSSAAKINEIKKKHINVKYVYRQNAGQTCARNAGIDLSQGEFIYMMDQDDVMVPNTIIPMALCAKKNNSDAVLFRCEHVDASEAEELVDSSPHVAPNIIKLTDGIGCIEYFNGFYPAGVWDKIYRRQLLNDASIRFIECKVVEEDLIFNLAVFRAAKSVVITDNIGYYWVQYPTSDSHTRDVKRLGEKRLNVYRLVLFLNETIDELSVPCRNNVKLLNRMRDVQYYFLFFMWTYMLQHCTTSYPHALEILKCLRDAGVYPLQHRTFPKSFGRKRLDLLVLYWLLSWPLIIKLALSVRLSRSK